MNEAYWPMDKVMLDARSTTIGLQAPHWCEPLAADRIYAEYEKHLGENSISREFGRAHCLMLRFTMEGDTVNARSIHRELLRRYASADLNCNMLDTVNAVVIDDMLKIILKRDRNSRHLVRKACQCLLEAVEIMKSIS
jgi:hypothetical protein